MIFFPTLFSLLAGFALPIFAAPTESTSGIILAPAQGAEIMPGSLFDFKYDARADYGTSSFNYTVWLFTTPPQSFSPADNFATGYFFGRFSEPNYPANPYPNNPPPTQLQMPDFSKNPGGFGIGTSVSNAKFQLVVIEEYATGTGSAGFRMSITRNEIIYNATETINP